MAGYIESTKRENLDFPRFLENQDYCTWQGSHSKLMEKEKAFQIRGKRIQYHQTSFTANVKGMYIVKKDNRRKKIYKINPKQLRKWQ